MKAKKRPVAAAAANVLTPKTNGHPPSSTIELGDRIENANWLRTMLFLVLERVGEQRFDMPTLMKRDWTKEDSHLRYEYSENGVNLRVWVESRPL